MKKRKLHPLSAVPIPTTQPHVPRTPTRPTHTRSLRWPITVQVPQGVIDVHGIFSTLKDGATLLRLVTLTETWVLQLARNFDPASARQRNDEAEAVSPLLKQLLGTTDVVTELDLMNNPPVHIGDLNKAMLLPVGDISARPPSGPRLTLLDPGFWNNVALWKEYESKKPRTVRFPFADARLHDGRAIAFTAFYRDDHTAEEAAFVATIQPRVLSSARLRAKKRRAGKEGGPRLKCGPKKDLTAAVALAWKLRRGPQGYRWQAACEQALRDYCTLQFPSGWRGLYYHVKKAHPTRSK